MSHDSDYADTRSVLTRPSIDPTFSLQTPSKLPAVYRRYEFSQHKWVPDSPFRTFHMRSDVCGIVGYVTLLSLRLNVRSRLPRCNHFCIWEGVIGLYTVSTMYTRMDGWLLACLFDAVRLWSNLSVVFSLIQSWDWFNCRGQLCLPFNWLVGWNDVAFCQLVLLWSMLYMRVIVYCFTICLLQCLLRGRWWLLFYSICAMRCSIVPIKRVQNFHETASSSSLSHVQIPSSFYFTVLDYDYCCHLSMTD